jgi:hypothetical protein
MRPMVTQAQWTAMPVIGFLGSGSPVPYAPFVAAFRQGLSETGYVEKENVDIEFRWAGSRFDRLPVLADELVARRVDVIATNGGTPLRARQETQPRRCKFDETRVAYQRCHGRTTGNMNEPDRPSAFWHDRTLIRSGASQLHTDLTLAETRFGVRGRPLNVARED